VTGFIISLMMVLTETGHRFLPQSVVLVRCRRLHDLVLQGTTKSTRKKSQECYIPVSRIRIETIFKFMNFLSNFSWESTDKIGFALKRMSYLTRGRRLKVGGHISFDHTASKSVRYEHGAVPGT